MAVVMLVLLLLAVVVAVAATIGTLLLLGRLCLVVVTAAALRATLLYRCLNLNLGKGLDDSLVVSLCRVVCYGSNIVLSISPER